MWVCSTRTNRVKCQLPYKCRGLGHVVPCSFSLGPKVFSGLCLVRVLPSTCTHSFTVRNLPLLLEKGGGTHACPPHQPPGLFLTPIKHLLMPGDWQFSKQASVASKTTRNGKRKLLMTVLNHRGCGQPLSSFSEASTRVVFETEQVVLTLSPKAPL